MKEIKKFIDSAEKFFSKIEDGELIESVFQSMEDVTIQAQNIDLPTCPDEETTSKMFAYANSIIFVAQHYISEMETKISQEDYDELSNYLKWDPCAIYSDFEKTIRALILDIRSAHLKRYGYEVAC